MKKILALVPIAVVTAGAAYVAFHPGTAYADPAFAKGTQTPLANQVAYTIDPMHASVSFEITHLGLSKVHGRINKFTGKIYEDEKDLTKSKVEFTAQMESIDTAVAPRDQHLRSADYFNVAKYPTMTFKSTKVAKVKEGYVVTGDLTIKDETKSVSIPFKHFGPYEMKGMADQPVRIGIIADPITVKRTDFGVSDASKLPDGTLGISDEVTVRISFEATRYK